MRGSVPGALQLPGDLRLQPQLPLRCRLRVLGEAVTGGGRDGNPDRRMASATAGRVFQAWRSAVTVVCAGI